YDSMVDYAADIADFADVLGIKRFGVAGLSGGGPFVLACAYAIPDRVVMACVLGGIGPTRGPETCPGYTRLLAPISPVLQLTKGPLAFLLNATLPSVRLVASSGADLYAKIAPPADRPLLRQAD